MLEKAMAMVFLLRDLFLEKNNKLKTPNKF